MKTRFEKRIFVVFGEKPLRNGVMHPAMKARLDLVAKQHATNPVDRVIITGGDTIKGVMSEAKMGQQYLSGKISVPVIQETSARTTLENILNVKKLIPDNKFRGVTIVSGRRRMWRIKKMLQKEWGSKADQVKLLGSEDFYSPFFIFREWLFYFYYLIDPNEKVFIGLIKKFFRNA